MGKPEQITIGLPVDIADAVNLAISDGEYKNAADVVLEALQQWKAARDVFGLTDEQIGALWDKGIASGPGRFASFDCLIEEAEGRAK